MNCYLWSVEWSLHNWLVSIKLLDIDNFLGKSSKNWLFTARLNVAGGGSWQMRNFWPNFFIEIWFFDTQNTFYLIVKGLKNAFFLPFLWLTKWGTSLLQMITRRATAVKGGIGYSSKNHISTMGGSESPWYQSPLIWRCFMSKFAIGGLAGAKLNNKSHLKPFLSWRMIPIYRANVKSLILVFF